MMITENLKFGDQKKLAKYFGVSRSFTNRLLRGVKKPTKESHFKLLMLAKLIACINLTDSKDLPYGSELVKLSIQELKELFNPN